MLKNKNDNDGYEVSISMWPILILWLLNEVLDLQIYVTNGHDPASIVMFLLCICSCALSFEIEMQ